MFRKNKLSSSQIKELGESEVYQSILELPDQLAQMWKLVSNMEMPSEYEVCGQVVVVGMGGSGLGARVVKSLGADKLSKPVELISDYNLPAYVDEDYLVVLSSYSGETKEVLTAASQAGKRGCRVLAITTGGKLQSTADEEGWPLISIKPEHNSSGQSRLGVGYMTMALMMVLKQIEAYQIQGEQVSKTINWMQFQQSKWDQSVPVKENAAKKLSKKLVNKGVMLVSGEFLQGGVHVFKNQLNESGKTFAVRFDLPELNHHLLEGLKKPEGLKKQLVVLLFDSDLYSREMSKRLAVTEEVMMKQGLQTIRLQLEGRSKDEQVWELIQFGEFVSFYLACLYGLKSSSIPWVKYFKEQLQ